MKTTNLGWDADTKNGGIRVVIKMLGKIACGALKIFLSNEFKIIGKTFLGDNFVATCIICFADANFSTFTNLIHSEIGGCQSCTTCFFKSLEILLIRSDWLEFFEL